MWTKWKKKKTKARQKGEKAACHSLQNPQYLDADSGSASAAALSAFLAARADAASPEARPDQADPTSHQRPDISWLQLIKWKIWQSFFFFCPRYFLFFFFSLSSFLLFCGQHRMTHPLFPHRAGRREAHAAEERESRLCLGSAWSLNAKPKEIWRGTIQGLINKNTWKCKNRKEQM